MTDPLWWVGLVIMGSAAIASSFAVTRRSRWAVRFALVESVAALVVVAVVVWQHNWLQTAVWTAIACAALGNLWLCRRIERLRRGAHRWNNHGGV